MSIHAVGDKVKIQVSKDQFGLGAGNGRESGVVVEVPDETLYLGFHSFGFDNSINNENVLRKSIEFYKKFLGKIVYWEALQDRGRRFQEGSKEFVILNMTDILAVDDTDEATAYLIDDINTTRFKG